MTLGSYTTVSIFHIGTHAGLSKIQNTKKRLKYLLAVKNRRFVVTCGQGNSS